MYNELYVFLVLTWTAVEHASNEAVIDAIDRIRDRVPAEVQGRILDPLRASREPRQVVLTALNHYAA